MGDSRTQDLRHIAGLAVAAVLALATSADAGGLPRRDEPAPADTVDMADTLVAAPDTAAAPADTLVAAPDTAAAPADTLVPAPETAAAPADTVDTATSPADTLIAAPDTAAAPADTLATTPDTTAAPGADQARPLSIPAVDVIVPVGDFGEFTIRVFPDETPQHVAAFLSLAGSGAYDSLGIHRVIPGFLIQTGDPKSRDEDRTNDGLSAPDWTIPAEPTDRVHRRGTVSMAWRGDDPASAGSQWYVMLADVPDLDGRGTPIGEVVDGMDVVDRVAQVSTLRNRHPLRPVRMGTLRVVPSPER